GAVRSRSVHDRLIEHPHGGAMIRSRSAAAFLALTAATVAALGGASRTSATPTSSAAPATPVKKGGILRIGTINGYDSMNPFVAYAAQSSDAFIMQCPTLVQSRQTGLEQLAIEGDWAKSWTTSKDGKTWTFKVKPGFWSDGKPLTAKDAVWTGNLVMKYKAGAT